MKDYKYLLFDLDDTLIENQESYKYAFQVVCDYLKIPYSDKLFKEFYEFEKNFWHHYENNMLHIPLKYNKNSELIADYLRRQRFVLFFANDFSEQEAKIVNDIFLDNITKVVVPIKGVFETLEYLANKYHLVIASNGPKEALNVKLEKINCLNFFEKCFSADMTKNVASKPNKEFFYELKQYINFYNNNEMLMIGDSLTTDIKGAMNSNIDSCWINRFNEELPNSYEPTMVVKTIKTLKKKL